MTDFHGSIYGMATFRKKAGTWEAAVCRKGIRQSKSFRTKAEAVYWAAEVERDIMDLVAKKTPRKTFGELLEEYFDRVSQQKKGWRFEMHRINAYKKLPIANKLISDLTPNDFALLRDSRLKEVSPGSVIREMNILSHALNTAMNDWGWIRVNPMSKIRRPPEPEPRDRILSEYEIEKLKLAMGYDEYEKPESIAARVCMTMLFAIETAMRAGEIAGLKWEDVDLDSRVALLQKTKNGSKRKVPLSIEAIRLINQVKEITQDREFIFDLNTKQIDVNFRKAKDRCCVDNLHYHDTRATAITRLAKKLDILDLARLAGHKNLKTLQIYYRESAEDIAKRLD